MKHIILSAFLCLSLLFSGCATTSQGIPPAQRKANLAQLKIGMGSPQVFTMIGRPARVNKTLTAAGMTEQWVYTDSQFWTPGQAMLVGMAAGAGGTPVHEGQLYLTFTNNQLSAIQTQQ